MKNLKYLILLIIITSSMGCEEVVDVDLNTAAQKLVIDASIDWVKGTDGSLQTVRLTKTTGFYETGISPVSNAAVTVTNSSNAIFEFVETPGTGEYVCSNFLPVIGELYVLAVIVEGQTYTASETLIAAPDIDLVEQSDEGGFTGELTEIKFFFQDNGAEDNFYMTAFETSITAFPDYDVYDDTFSQGSQNFGLFLNEDLESGDQMTFSLYGISERYMNYMNTLLAISDGGGGLWQTPPTNVRGNIINATDNTNFALGYFRLSEVDRMDYIVQ